MVTEAAASTTGRAAPTKRDRVVGIDVARCLALIGMMATHILPSATDDGNVTVMQQLAGGRASALFAVLAGVSLALVSGRGEPVRGRELDAVRAGIATRALIIGCIGLALGPLESHVAVILTYYAVLFLLGLPFLGLGWRALVWLAGAWAIAAPVVAYVVREHLPGPSYGNPTFGRLADEPLHVLQEITFTGYYPTFSWLAYLFAGLAVGRALNLERVVPALIGAGAALAATTWLLSWMLVYGGEYAILQSAIPNDIPIARWPLDFTLVHGMYGTTPTTSWWWLTIASPHTATPFDLLQTIGSAMVIIGLAVAAGRRVPRLLSVVFGAGAMTLTLYTLHVWALAAEIGPDRGWTLYAWHVGAAVMVGALWHTYVGSGPLEWITTRLSSTVAGAVRSR